MDKRELKKIPASHFLLDNNSRDCGFIKGDKVKRISTGEESIVTKIDAYIPLYHPRDAVCYFIDLSDGTTMGESTEIGSNMEGKEALKYYRII